MGNLIRREKEVKELTELYIRFRRSLFPTHPSNQASARHSRCLLELQSTLVTTYGLEYNEYSSDFQQVVTLEDLFKEA